MQESRPRRRMRLSGLLTNVLGGVDSTCAEFEEIHADRAEKQPRAIVEVLEGGHAGLSKPWIDALNRAAAQLEERKDKSDDLPERLRGCAQAGQARNVFCQRAHGHVERSFGRDVVMTENTDDAANKGTITPPPLQPSGLHVPPLPSHPSVVLPAPLRTLPWITDAATDYIDSVIALKRVAGEPIIAMECGSGSSTGYLAQRVTRLVSFDHDGNWHAAIRVAVTAIGCGNVEWRTAERPYARFFKDYADESFDIVLVDGRDRTSCVEHARRILKPAGVLVADNTERISGIDGRGPYFEMLRHLDGWQSIHFEQPWKDRAGWAPPHRWITSVWRKPTSAGTIFTTLGNPL
jgi:hypothetical protein